MILAGQLEGLGEEVTPGRLALAHLPLQVFAVPFQVLHHEVLARQLKHQPDLMDLRDPQFVVFIGDVSCIGISRVWIPLPVDGFWVQTPMSAGLEADPYVRTHLRSSTLRPSVWKVSATTDMMG